MEPVAYFFSHLQEKCCSVCGQKLWEQAESYATECLDCHEKLLHPQEEK
ncbi:protein YhfH [Brevibacillus fulvus]|uniref:YhfH family protein n=2 Tax=Brevibacillus fulvus TaxID=1125967 RepID=A0A938Y237_9BACL|nr:protein YhfH [Brevibacillus fulvus]MBM7589780.1 hypothetical protein [Brevibacillus fulvus]